jgi:hypothetical protein
MGLSPSSEKLHSLRRADLAGARELRLAGLSEFPREIFGLADTLELLDLSGGTLTHLPADMGRLHKLRVLFCSGNRFDRLPEALGGCASLSQIGFRGSGITEIPGEALPPLLRWLTLTDNRIRVLPKELGERRHLQKLMLAGNGLARLPDSLRGAPSLELLRLSCNAFDALPAWLGDLPRLAWITWGGNPLERDPPPSNAALIPWRQITVCEPLGEGTSGRVYRALWTRDGAESAPVALKLFKTAMTSDGLPEREIAACLAAGAHPHLTGALGRVADHPEGAEALLMPLLPAHWRVLAQPPSLESCSRDVFDPDLRLDLATALRIARSVAAAAAHLHERGILHGDLYAHNTLWDGDGGDAVLSDFGAACALPQGLEGDAWRRVEVRAWGLLLGELLDLCPADAEGLAKGRALEGACVQPTPSARPLLREIVDAL